MGDNEIKINDIDYTIGSDEFSIMNDTGSEYTINLTSASTTTSTIDSPSTFSSFAPTFTYDLGTDKELDLIDFDEIEEMCEEYPGLKNVYEKFKHVYDLVRQDWIGKQKDVI